MAIRSYYSYLLIFSIFAVLILYTEQLQTSQTWSLLRIKQLLNYPSVLSGWNKHTNFCKVQTTASVTVVCYKNSLTQLHIIGKQGSPPLPKNFSIDALFITLTRLPDLKVLTLASLGLWGPLPATISRLSSLEIVNMSNNFLSGAIPQAVSNLTNLQTLILDYNLLTDGVPDWLNALPVLAVLSLKNNTLNGSLPDSIGKMVSLRTLVLSSNNLTGELPDLSDLTNLQVLDLENNSLGPQFPKLGKKVVSVVLRKNRFGGGLPAELSYFYTLQLLDVSLNRFVGPFMPPVLSLPLIRYINIAGNRFTGMLFKNMSCNDELVFVDLSSNLLSGNLPACLSSGSKEKVVFYWGNCLDTNDPSQHPSSFCQNQALAVGILPETPKEKSVGKAVIQFSVLGVAIVCALLVGLLIFFTTKMIRKRRMKEPPGKLTEHASSGYSTKLLADARYISQTMKLGALGLPSYRSFSLEELEAATDNFGTSTFMGEVPHGQMHRGKLNNGMLVTVCSLKLKKKQSSHNFNRHIELILKLRHYHLVSALGHCFEYDLDDSSVSQLFLIFEYVSDENLRSVISKGLEGKKFIWTHRISAAIGIAKGIQFLHGGIIPGLFANDLKITNIFLDQNLVAKISSYNLPILAENMKTEVGAGESSLGSKESIKRVKHGDKIDIYDFGVILLEIVCGKPVTSHYEVKTLKNQLQSSIIVDGAARRRSIIDPVVSRTCSGESLKTVMELCLRCLSEDPTERPSVEDVLWNLQFAAQVQDAWRRDSQSSEDFPPSPSQDPNSPVN
ncbi:probable inactive leucine-rich repeat receptor-like protein kinase At3g03770 [Typha latifolia]|uniref:probable inactive leucine-rich repeat receptor-like protein kinase At3g03770 n=1 Tax=Typha latifolia TaxID=4733 RepID=UPI003C2EA7B2